MITSLHFEPNRPVFGHAKLFFFGLILKKKKNRSGKLSGRIELGLIVLQVKWHFKRINNGFG